MEDCSVIAYMLDRCPTTLLTESRYDIVNDLLTRPGWMEDCGEMHKCWTIAPLFY